MKLILKNILLKLEVILHWNFQKYILQQVAYIQKYKEKKGNLYLMIKKNSYKK